jgi:recombinational DNA repair protein RecT
LLGGNTSNLKIYRSFTKMKKDTSGNVAHIASAKQLTKNGFFKLTHSDSEHNDEHWKTYKKVEANITKIHDDPSHAIPLGPWQ